MDSATVQIEDMTFHTVFAIDYIDVVTSHIEDATSHITPEYHT